jgi:hypothetical protein
MEQDLKVKDRAPAGEWVPVAVVVKKDKVAARAAAKGKVVVKVKAEAAARIANNYGIDSLL